MSHTVGCSCSFNENAIANSVTRRLQHRRQTPFALIAHAVDLIGDVVTTAVVFFLRYDSGSASCQCSTLLTGHTRAEGIAASNAALLVIISALMVGWEAIRRIMV